MVDVFVEVGVVVIGVFKDSVKKYDKFCDKYELKVILLLDEDGIICEDYGVWVEKKMYGKIYMGIECVMFLIDVNGKIVQVWEKVKVFGYVDVVLEVV